MTSKRRQIDVRRGNQRREADGNQLIDRSIFVVSRKIQFRARLPYKWSTTDPRAVWSPSRKGGDPHGPPWWVDKCSLWGEDWEGKGLWHVDLGTEFCVRRDLDLDNLVISLCSASNGILLHCHPSVSIIIIIIIMFFFLNLTDATWQSEK